MNKCFQLVVHIANKVMIQLLEHLGFENVSQMTCKEEEYWSFQEGIYNVYDFFPAGTWNETMVGFYVCLFWGKMIKDPML